MLLLLTWQATQQCKQGYSKITSTEKKNEPYCQNSNATVCKIDIEKYIY